jgi:hypothetical protein
MREHRNYGWAVCILALCSRAHLVPGFPKQRILFPLAFFVANSVMLNNSLLQGPTNHYLRHVPSSCYDEHSLCRDFSRVGGTEFDVALVVRRRGGSCKEKPPPTFLFSPLPAIRITALLVYVRRARLAHGDVSPTNNPLPTTHKQNYPLP